MNTLLWDWYLNCQNGRQIWNSFPLLVSKCETICGLGITRFMLILNLQESSLLLGHDDSTEIDEAKQTIQYNLLHRTVYTVVRYNCRKFILVMGFKRLRGTSSLKIKQATSVKNASHIYSFYTRTISKPNAKTGLKTSNFGRSIFHQVRTTVHGRGR